MSKRKLGIRVLSSKKMLVSIGDTIEKVEYTLNKIARLEELSVVSSPDYNIQQNKLGGWVYTIPNLIDVHFGLGGVADRIKIMDIVNHEIECDKNIYSFDCLHHAGFQIIINRGKHISYYIDKLDNAFNELQNIESKEEKVFIYGNDCLNKIAFIIKAKDNVLTSMEIASYVDKYTYNDYKDTGIEW